MTSGIAVKGVKGARLKLRFQVYFVIVSRIQPIFYRFGDSATLKLLALERRPAWKEKDSAEYMTPPRVQEIERGLAMEEDILPRTQGGQAVLIQIKRWCLGSRNPAPSAPF